MTEVSKTPVAEMSLEEIEAEYDSLPREVESLSDYKVVKKRRVELAQEYNSRTEPGPASPGPGVSTRRILSES